MIKKQAKVSGRSPIKLAIYGTTFRYVSGRSPISAIKLQVMAKEGEFSL